MLSRILFISAAGLIAIGALTSDVRPTPDAPAAAVSAGHALVDTLAVDPKGPLRHLTPIRTHVSEHDPVVATVPVTAPPRADRHFESLDPDDCFMCHDDDSMTMERDGAEVSLFVDPAKFRASRHGSLDCVACHVGFDPEEEPHRDEILPVDCSSCHPNASSTFAHSAHSRSMKCTTCHEDVHTNETLVVTQSVCRDCHDDAAADLDESIHASSHFAPTCLNCHTPHQFKPADAATCLSCHGDPKYVSEHIPQEDIKRVLAFEQSIHADLIDCADCHEGHKVYDVSDPRSVVSRNRIASTCAACHEDIAEHYEKSEHAKALATNFAQAPTCTDCHGEHEIHEVTDTESKMSRSNEVETCLACHLDSPEVQARMTHTAGFVAAYEWSVHGRAAAEGNLKAAICSDCHGAHDAMKASNPEALINQFNIAETCGNCHEDEFKAFKESIHGQALTEGIGDAPTCTTCHSEHEILRTADARSPVAVINVSQEVCTPCHESFKLSEKYGFPSGRTASFSNSYHGLAGRAGSTEAANCASCHGVHDIFPSSDPRSTVNPANLEKTCGTCHPGANANFSRGSVHVIRTPEGDRLLYWIGVIYIGLIAVTIGGMSLHNILDWVRKTQIHYREQLHPTHRAISEDRRTGLYVRMTANERIQHALLASSFMLLVLTGFMLKFPDAWWVVSLRDVIGQRMFDLRGLLHRIAAVVMVADSFYHVYYVAFTKRGRRFISDIMFRKSDFREMVQMLRFNLGRTSQRPRFDRFNYIEKSEYWALIWGTIVMSVTGVVLWFENTFMAEYSKLFVDVNETIHYYEAWLAFLAIVVWHFYYVIFNPDVYPMNFTWLTGKVTEREMEHEHPVELERLRAQEEERTPEDTSPTA